MKKLFGTALLAGLVFGFGFETFGQTMPNGNETVMKERRGRMRGGQDGMRHGKGMMRGLQQLDLSDTQKEQIRTIMQTNHTANESVRQEMMTLRDAKRNGTLTTEQTARMEALKEQMKQSHEQTQTQILAVLTPEQRQKYDQMQEEMRQKRQEKRQRRENGEVKKDQIKPQN